MPDSRVATPSVVTSSLCAPRPRSHRIAPSSSRAPTAPPTSAQMMIVSQSGSPRRPAGLERDERADHHELRLCEVEDAGRDVDDVVADGDDREDRAKAQTRPDGGHHGRSFPCSGWLITRLLLSDVAPDSSYSAHVCITNCKFSLTMVTDHTYFGRAGRLARHGCGPPSSGPADTARRQRGFSQDISRPP